MGIHLDTSISLLLNSKDVRWYDERRALIIENRAIELTETEYRLFVPLLSGEPVTYAELADSVYGTPLNSKVRIMLDKHIDRIRGKLRGSGLYIYCILGYGHVLLPELEE